MLQPGEQRELFAAQPDPLDGHHRLLVPRENRTRAA